MSIPECVSWTGCPAVLACWHYRKNEDGPRARVTALCKACSGALAKMLRKWPDPQTQRRLRLRR